MAIKNTGRLDPFVPLFSENSSASPIVIVENSIKPPVFKIYTPKPVATLKPIPVPVPTKTIKLLGVIKGTKDMALVEVDDGKEKHTYKVEAGEKFDNYTINKIELGKVTLEQGKNIEAGKETEIK